MRQEGWRLGVKRALDTLVAGAGLLGSAPVLAGTALALRISVGSPVLFRQQRPGRGGEPFELVKFRTMLNTRDAQGQLLPDAERLTRVGLFVRSTSLDELPQLWNVLRGDMSLVGPRPLLTRYLSRYTPEQARRHQVMPGVTGWAQVNGRNSLTWPEKFKLDLYYVDHWSLRLDLRILLATLRTVATRSGVSNAAHATMPEFMGSSQEEHVGASHAIR